MEPRNEINTLETAGIPVALDHFECSYWGRHHPPHVDEGVIVIEVGEGYRSRSHLHGQNLYVIETDPANHVALVEMRKYGDLYGSGLWHYLIGIDGAPFVAQIPNTVETLSDAIEYLKPVEVKRAEEAGMSVIRQGDWYFVPVDRTPRGEPTEDTALEGTDHIAAEAVALKTVTYVRGIVRHGEHAAVELDGWHKALRNKAIRVGRLARRNRGYVD